MKTRWFKGLAAAAVAAFTFGFAPSAQAYNIVISEWIEHGRVTCDQETADEYEQVVFQAEPEEEGFKLTRIWAVGGDSGIEYEMWQGWEGYTLLMPGEDITVYAEFQQEAQPHAIYVQDPVGGGEVRTNPEDGAMPDTLVEIIASPKEGYARDEMTVFKDDFSEEVEVTPTGTGGTFVMPPCAVNVEVTFKAQDQTITLAPFEHGTVTTSPAGSAKTDETVEITATPEDGYERDEMTVTKTGTSEQVKVTPTEEGGNFTMPACGVEVAVTFKKTATKYGITIDEEIQHGSVMADKEKAAKDEAVTLTVTPAAGYATSELKYFKTDDPSEEVEISGNTFTMPDYAVTVTATFEAQDQIITLAPFEHGWVDTAPAGSARTDETVTIYPSPELGYAVGALKVTKTDDPSTEVPVSDNQFTMPPYGVTVAVTFEAQSQTISIAGTEHGMVETEPAGSARTDETVTITTTPDPGYALKTISVAGTMTEPEVTMVEEGKTYTFVMPYEEVTVAATFEAAAVPHDIIIQYPEEGGVISADPETAKKGEKVTLNVTPWDHYLYVESSLQVMGDSGDPVETTRTSENEFTFVMPDENVSVSASFEGEPYQITVNTQGGTPMEPLNYRYSIGNTTELYLEQPEKEGYEFAGWSGDAQDPTASLPEGLSFQDPVLAVAAGTYGDKTIYAHWVQVKLPTVEVTPAEVANATAKVYTNGVEVALAGEPPSCNVYENQENTIIVYTANDGYAFEGGATTYTNNVDTSKNPATIVPGQAVPEAPTKVVAKIGDVYYETLPAAFGAVKSGETITMVGDVEDLAITASPYLTLAKGKAVTFDLAGHRIYGETATKGNTVMLQVNGDLTVTDSSEGKTGYFGVKALNPSEVAAYGNYLLYIPNGSVTLEAGTLENLSEGPACYVFQMGGESNAVTVNGGTARAVSPVARMFYYSAAPTMNFTLNGGLLESTRSVGIQYFAYSVSGRSAITVAGGEIKADKYGIYAYGTDGGLDIDISGGKITTANEEYSAICLYNYRPQAFEEPTSVNITGGTVVGSQFLMEVYDYYGVTRTTISDGTFGGQIYLYTKDASRIDQCRLDNYCVQISGGTFKNFGLYEGSQAKVYWENFSGLSLIGGAYNTRIATEPNPNGRVAEGYTYVWDEGRSLWLVVPGTIAGDVICEKGDETTIETAEKPAETKEEVWESATNIVATAVTTEAPVIVADVELTNAVDQAKSEVPEGSTVIAVFAEVNLTITPKSALADDQDKVTAVTMNVTPSLMTWSVVDNGSGTITTNEVGEARNFEYSGKPMTVSFSVADMAYPPVQVVHRHSDDYAETYGRGELPSDTTFAYDAETQTITLMMRSFSDIEVYSAIQVGDTAYATIGADGTCTVSGTGDMWSFDDPTSAVLWGNHAAIRRVDIGEGVTSVGKNAFAFQKGVLTITIGGGVTNICEDAFFSCLNVTDLSVGAGVQTVGKSAFGRCNSLTDLSFGSKEVAEACQGKAFKIVARITMNGSTPVIDAVPKVTIAGYVRTLYGAETLAGPWEAIADETNIPAKYHFFKYEYNAEEK